MPPLKTGCCEQSDVVCFHRLMDQSEVEITTVRNSAAAWGARSGL